MKREFLINLGFLILINVLIKPFFIFGIDLQVQNRTGKEYGLYFALLNLTYLFQILSDFGLQNFNNRQISQYPRLLQKYFPDLFSIKLLLSLFYIIAALGAGALIGYSYQALYVLFILLFNLSLVQLNFFLRSNISGLGHYRADSFLSSLDKFLMAITGAILLWMPGNPFPVNIETFAWSQTLAQVMATAVIMAYLKKKGGVNFSIRWTLFSRQNRARLTYWLKASFPYALVILLMTAYTRLDAVLLERILPDGKAHAEVYAGAYRLLDAFNMLGFLFASLLLPMFARMLRQKQPIDGLVGLSFKLIFIGSVTVAAAVFFARHDLITLMMAERASTYRSDTLGILIWAFIPVSSMYIFSSLLTANEQLRDMNRYFILSIALDLTLNLFLIPRYQASGAAISALATQFFIAANILALCQRTFRFTIPASIIARHAVWVALVLITDWLLYNQAALPPAIRFLAALALGPAAAFLLGLFDLRLILKQIRMP